MGSEQASSLPASSLLLVLEIFLNPAFLMRLPSQLLLLIYIGCLKIHQKITVKNYRPKFFAVCNAS